MANIDKVTINGTDYKLIDSTVPAWAKASTKPSYTASEISGLANVATSGNYNDLLNKPEIPEIPEDTHQIVISVDLQETPLVFQDWDGNNLTHEQAAEIFSDPSKTVILYDTSSDVIYRYCGLFEQYYFNFSAPYTGGINYVVLLVSNPLTGIITVNKKGRVDYVPDTRKINNKRLSGDITLTASDVGAVPTTRTVNGKALSSNITLSASDVGAITRFVVDFTLSGTTISNPNKTFLEIKAAYDAGNLVLARDNNSSLYYLLYCDTGECGFFNCDSDYLYDINVDSSNVWSYQITDISQLNRDLSNKSEVIYMGKVNNVWRKLTYDSLNGNWIIDSAALTTGNIKNIYFDKDNNDLYYWDGSAFVLVDEDNVQPDWNQSDSTKADYIKNKPVIPNSIKVGSVAGKLYRDDVNGSGNFTVKGNSGCIPNLTAGTFLVSIYAKSTTQSYTFRFNFGSVTYDLSTTNGEINDVRQITIPSNGTFSGLVLNGSVASGTILYVVMYNYLTPVSTVGIAAVTNRYSDLDGTPTIPTVNNGTLTIQKNGTTVQTFTANQSGSVTANIIVPTTASDIGALPSSTHIPADQVQSNWNETNTSSKAYILNKPSLAIEIVTNSNSGSVTQAMDANKFYKFTGSPTSITITLNSALGLGVYGGKFTANANGTTLVLPSSVTVASSAPSIEGGNTYEFNIADNVLLMVEV